MEIAQLMELDYTPGSAVSAKFILFMSRRQYYYTYTADKLVIG